MKLITFVMTVFIKAGPRLDYTSVYVDVKDCGLQKRVRIKFVDNTKLHMSRFADNTSVYYVLP